MELYNEKSESFPQKTVIVIFEILFLVVAYKILFASWGDIVYDWLALPAPAGHKERNAVNFIFSCIVFLRFSFMMFFLLKRKIPLEEVISVPFAFALYYIGFALFTIDTSAGIHGVDFIGIAFFVIGSFINTFSELQRHIWKQDPQNKGRLYTGGLFGHAMHINYLGDILWVAGYAIISRNVWAWSIPIFLLCFFVFYNIPKLDDYLKNRYKEQFEYYARKTKKLIPFIY